MWYWYLSEQESLGILGAVSNSLPPVSQSWCGWTSVLHSSYLLASHIFTLCLHSFTCIRLMKSSLQASEGNKADENFTDDRKRSFLPITHTAKMRMLHLMFDLFICSYQWPFLLYPSLFPYVFLLYNKAGFNSSWLKNVDSVLKLNLS